MNLASVPEARIQIPINRETQFGTFNDALYFTAAEFQALTGPQLVAQVTARVQAWVASVANPPAPTPPTLADVQTDTGEVLDRITALSNKLNNPPWAANPALNPLRTKVAAMIAARDANG